MKRLKHGVSLVAVLIALFVASLGGAFGSFTASTSEVSVDSTYRRHEGRRLPGRDAGPPLVEKD